MNCCDEYGDCQQSDTCPARTGTVLPHQAAHAARVVRVKSTRPAWMDGKATHPRTCDELGICQGRGDCDCTHPMPPEADNFRIIDLGLDDYDQPLSLDKSYTLMRALLIWLVSVLALVALVSVSVSYTTERWADVLWAYLAALS
jgi:hypothetical protein